jgi:hypothetical protein
MKKQPTIWHRCDFCFVKKFTFTVLPSNQVFFYFSTDDSYEIEGSSKLNKINNINMVEMVLAHLFFFLCFIEKKIK